MGREEADFLGFSSSEGTVGKFARGFGICLKPHPPSLPPVASFISHVMSLSNCQFCVHLSCIYEHQRAQLKFPVALPLSYVHPFGVLYVWHAEEDL